MALYLQNNFLAWNNNFLQIKLLVFFSKASEKTLDNIKNDGKGQSKG